jgi:hypothetical protein
MAIRDYTYGLELLTSLSWSGTIVASVAEQYITVCEQQLNKIRRIVYHSMGANGTAAQNPLLFFGNENDFTKRVSLPAYLETRPTDIFHLDLYGTSTNSILTEIWTPQGVPAPVKLYFRSDVTHYSGQITIWAEPNQQFLVQRADIITLQKTIEHLLEKLERR